MVKCSMSLSSNKKNIREWTIDKLNDVKEVLSQESDETKEMLQIYARFTLGEATPEEMKAANAQFADILKTLGLGAFAVLPFAPLTIPLVVKIGKIMGIDILPSSYKTLLKKKTEKNKN